MQILLFLAVILAIVSAINPGPRRKAERMQDTAALVAREMGYYHMAAVRMCSAAPGACADGTVSPPAPGGAVLDFPGHFRSAYDAARQEVVTTWVPPASAGLDPYYLDGSISGALAAQNGFSPWVGEWDSAAQTISRTREFTYMGGEGPQYPGEAPACAGGSYSGCQYAAGGPVTSGSAAPKSLPQGTGGLALQDGAPVMVTPLYF